MTPKHPTPWRAGATGSSIYDADGSMVAGAIDLETVDLIIRAVNAHEAVLKKCEALRREWSSGGGVREMILEEILALARGEVKP